MESNFIIDKFGNKKWYNENGELHRENDLPAIEYSDGNREWFVGGKRHRDNGPAVQEIDIEYSNSSYSYEAWYKEGKLHRLDGPSVIFYNTKYWYKEGKLHRLDGPAIEYTNGDKEWCYEDKYIECNSQEEFEKILQK